MLFQLNSFYPFFSILFLTLFAAGSSFSQNISGLDSLEGKFALQFQVSDNFTLNNFQGTTFSGKYNFGCRNAVRAGLSIDFTSGESGLSESFPDTSFIRNANIDREAFGITINAQYIQYITGSDNIAFFLGGGPYLSFNNSTGKFYDSSTDPEYTSEETIDNFSTGVDLLMGVEWIFTKNMSLSAEYGIKFSYRNIERIAEDINIKRENTDKSFSVLRGNINFGISVYF
jgi:opacity protein-like surface antigen